MILFGNIWIRNNMRNVHDSAKTLVIHFRIQFFNILKKASLISKTDNQKEWMMAIAVSDPFWKTE